MIDRELIFVAGGLTGRSLPSRPAALASAFGETGSFKRLLRVQRRRPWDYVAARVVARIGHRGLDSTRTEESLVEHPWPFGSFERSFIARLVQSRSSDGVVWIADPKSAGAFRNLHRLGSKRPLLVFDAYDAWDLSPLVRGTRRLRAVRVGYGAAAELADLVFANTPLMVERMRALGARSVHLLPNGTPGSDDPGVIGPGAPAARAPYVLYVGRIHERVDVRFLVAVAQAIPDATLRVVGPVERVPPGWATLASLPNVDILGPLPGNEARLAMAGAAACLVPHVVDDYALSQDAMKAWDALAVGSPVISTPVPPAVWWPTGMAVVAQDPGAFADAARRAVAGRVPGSPERRRAFAAANTWAARARSAVEVIEEALRSWA